MPLRINSDLPDLQGATNWYNGGPVSGAELLGSPTLVHFWSVSCGICSEQMPQVVAWSNTFGPQGLRMVAVHMPRSEKDLDLARVQECIADYGLKHPVAVDNTHALVDAFDNKYVPAFYLFDAEGHLRQYVAGEKGLALLETAITRVMARCPSN